MLPRGGGGRSGCQHQQSAEGWFANVPGLKIVAPTTPADVRAFYRASIRDDDPTLFIYQRALLNAVEAAKEAEAETGKSIEIIDPRVLIPFDKQKVFDSVKKTGRLFVTHGAPERGGFSAQIVSWVTGNCLSSLKAAPVRVCGANGIIPFGELEDYLYSSKADIKAG
ncbi:MAG: hypothetical protein LBL20_02455, partial [Treponema sp.]|nr:hypothetical protein [Treponema sp.]